MGLMPTAGSAHLDAGFVELQRHAPILPLQVDFEMVPIQRPFDLRYTGIPPTPCEACRVLTVAPPLARDEVVTPLMRRSRSSGREVRVRDYDHLLHLYLHIGRGWMEEVRLQGYVSIACLPEPVYLVIDRIGV